MEVNVRRKLGYIISTQDGMTLILTAGSSLTQLYLTHQIPKTMTVIHMFGTTQLTMLI